MAARAAHGQDHTLKSPSRPESLPDAGQELSAAASGAGAAGSDAAARQRVSSSGGGEKRLPTRAIADVSSLRPVILQAALEDEKGRQGGGHRLLVAVSVMRSLTNSPEVPPMPCDAKVLEEAISACPGATDAAVDAALAQLIEVGRGNEELHSLLLAARLAGCIARARTSSGGTEGDDPAASGAVL